MDLGAVIPIRIRAKEARRIRDAAHKMKTTRSAFMREAAIEKAEEVLAMSDPAA